MLTPPKRDGHRRFAARHARGNMIIVTCAFLCLFIVIMLFALSFVRLSGGQHQQKTAIEAAALAAATDVSRMVILDPNFGYVSFSDVAPVGTATTAGDNYYMPVSSINSLMGTIRLDLTIANALNNPTMQAMAQRDLTNLLTAKNNLVSAINASLVAGGSGKDANGNTITPYADALAAYNDNRINMTGSSSYVANSMVLTLGSVPTGDTNIPIPNPTSYANCNSSQQSNGYYVPNVDIPTSDGTDFVFAALGNTAKLVDSRNFATTLSGLPYNMPSVVKVEADQTMNDNGAQRTIHAAAAAQGNNCYDPRPAPGALSFSFPDGTPPEVTKPIDLLSPPFTSGVPTIGQTPSGGDYPTDPPATLGPITWTGPSSPPDPAGGVSTGIYDWIKRGGPKMKVDAVLAMANTPFTFSGMSADNILATNMYTADANGNVVYSVRELSDPGISPPSAGSYNPAGGPAGGANPISVVSDQQLFVSALNALNSADGFTYDMYVRDTDYNPGIVKGGKHGGEPLTNSLLTATTTNVSPANMTIASADLEPIKIAMNGTTCSGSAYDCGGSGDGAHWGINIGGPPGAAIAELDITTPDGHPMSFIVYINAINTRNDFGKPYGIPYYTFSLGPHGGATRPTYLQNGLVSEVRMRRVIPLAKAGLSGFGYADFGHRTYPPPPPYPVSPAFSLP